MTGVEI